MKKIIPTKLIHLDTCLPNYFSGYHLPVLTVAVRANMSAAQFIEAVEDEYNMIWDHLDYGFNLDNVDITSMAQDILTDKNSTNVFPELEPIVEEEEHDGYDSVYCHLTFTDEE